MQRLSTVRLGSSAWVPCAVAMIAVTAGVGIAHGYLLPVSLAIALGIALVAGVVDWRRWTRVLLLYLPFSGVLILAAYPRTVVPLLLKDVVFVIPIYIGFAAGLLNGGERTSPARVPIVFLSLFMLLVLAQILNPGIPNLLTGVIGAKVWLLYIPLCFVGYHLIETQEDLIHMLRWMSLVAAVPAAIGLLESVLVYAGHADLVYHLYGRAASAVTQEFAQLSYGRGSALRRVPSIFSSVTQYFDFLMAALAVSYSSWRARRIRRERSLSAAAIVLLILAATFLSGARGAFIFVPLAVVVTVLLDHRERIGMQRIAAAGWKLAALVVALLTTAAAIGTTGAGILSTTWSTLVFEVNDLVVTGFSRALSLTWLGLGTGVDTAASRYASAGQATVPGVGGLWYEGWYVKALLELGVVGLILIVVILSIIARAMLRQHRTLNDPAIAAISASFIAFFVWGAAAGLKGQYLDFDPVNVYFWLFVGIVFKLGTLDGREDTR